MIFKFLTAIVFIAEIIIGFTLIINLIKLDKKILALNETVTQIKPGLKDICSLIRAISFQIRELISDYSERLIKKREDMALRFVIKAFAGIVLWKTNLKIIKKLRKSKAVKTIAKGLTLLQIVV